MMKRTTVILATLTVGISEALNMTLAGVVAHQSALKDGEWMKIPQYDL